MRPTWSSSKSGFAIRSLCTAGIAAIVAICQCQAQVVNWWDQPAAKLAAQVAETLGPGPVAFSIRNLSSIHAEQVVSIRKTLEASLKTHGVTVGGSESANAVRVTLSQNIHEQLWVAEIIEGNETKVKMVEFGPIDPEIPRTSAALTLRRQTLVLIQGQVLAALEIPSGLLMLEPEQAVLFTKTDNSWKEVQRARINMSHPLGRDPRGVLLGSAGGSVFDASLPGVHCSGSIGTAPEIVGLKITCSESDDPWAVTQPPIDLAAIAPSTSSANVAVAPIRAFYNAARNSFTGVLVPSLGSDLQPFYSLAQIPHNSGYSVLVDGVDGKVQLVENGAAHVIAGTRDWGSDITALYSGCGAAAQLVVSGSGDAASDSLRAYDLPSFEAIPASEPLDLDGSVMTLNAAADGKSLLAIVRHPNNMYEVDRVTALCN